MIDSVMRCQLSLALLFGAAAWGQAPVITGFVNSGDLSTNFGPGSPLVVFGKFTSPSAGRDYTITVGGQTTGINVAFDSVFILATVPPTAPSGQQTLVITYQGAPSNALPIIIAPVSPVINNYSISSNGSQGPPVFNAPHAFSDAHNSAVITPTAPAATGQALQLTLSGIGQSYYPNATPTVTVAGLPAQVAGINPNPGNEQIIFNVPANAPAGVDPVVVTVAGVPSNTGSQPIGAAPGIGSIVNGASFGSAGVVAPGSIITVFGAGFGTPNNLSAFPSTTVNGTQVKFGSVAAPIFALAATSGQINALVPMESPAGPLNVTVTNGTSTSAAFSVTVATAAPGMFYLTDPLLVTRHNAIAVKANTAWLTMPLSMATAMSIPTNCSNLGAAQTCAQPAKPGDILQLYVTGLGLATPNGDPHGTPLPTGSLAPVSGSPLYVTLLTPTVTIGGKNATVLFSGMAPGFSGLYQLDVQIPTDASTGDDVPIQISSGGVTDNATIALTGN